MCKELWYEKAACKILVKLTRHTKVLCTAFNCLQFGFVIFWQKDFGAKAAHKMLVKLTPASKAVARTVIMEQIIFERLPLIREGDTEKVSHFKRSVKPNYN